MRGNLIYDDDVILQSGRMMTAAALCYEMRPFVAGSTMHSDTNYLVLRHLVTLAVFDFTAKDFIRPLSLGSLKMHIGKNATF